MNKIKPKLSLHQLQIHWTLLEGLSTEEKHSLRTPKQFPTINRIQKKNQWFCMDFKQAQKRQYPSSIRHDAQQADIPSANELDQAVSLN